MANEIKYKVGFDVNHSDLNKLKSSLQQLQKLSISDIMKINNVDSNAAITTLGDITREASKVQDALNKAFNVKLGTVNIEAFNKALHDSTTSMDQVYATFKKGGTAGENTFRTLANEVTKTNIQLKQSHSLLDNIATTLTNTIKWNLASSAVNTMSQSIQQAWGYVKNLDNSLNDIRIVTNKSAEQMANFAVQANQAAQSLGKTTTDYTKAALIYAQQGLSDEEIAARTAVTLKTANVTGQSTAEVSEQLTAVWNGYKVNAEQAEVYVDRLAAVAATTASDLQELSTGMSKVASAAAAMGVGEDQLAAQLSTIISVTRQAPESIGTALRTIYARITDIKAGIDEEGVDLGRYSGKMAELGFNVLDAAGNLRDMGQVIEEIGYKWQDLTREQQVSLAQTMAGQRQYSNLIALFDNFDKYTEALNTAREAAGTLNEQQDIYLERTSTHLTQLKTATQNLYDSLLNPQALNPLIDSLTSVVNLAASFVDSIGGGASVLTLLGTTAVTVFSQQISSGIMTFISNLNVAKQNSKQITQMLESIGKFGNLNGLDESTKKILSQKEELYRLASAASPEQFNEIQGLIDKITQLSNQVTILKKRKEDIDKIIGTVGSQTSIFTNVEDTYKNKEAQDAILDAVVDQEEEFQKARKAFSKYKDELAKTDDVNDKIKQSYDKATSAANNYLEKLQTIVKNNSFYADSTKGLDNLIQRFKQLSQIEPEDLTDDQRNELDLLADKITQVAQKAQKVAKETGDQLTAEFQETGESIRKQLTDTQAAATDAANKITKEFSNIKINMKAEDITKMVGGFGQLISSVQILQNLGKSNSIGQIFQNLTIGLPMLISGTSKVATAMGLLKFQTDAVAAAASSAKIKIELLNGILLMNPWTIAIAGITVVVSGLAALVKGYEQANKAAIEHNNALIEEENKKQQQIQDNNNLYSSIENLNKQYNQGKIVRNELKSQIDNLIDQYGLEGDAANKLKSNYDNLTESIKEAREQAARQAKGSADREKKHAAQLIQQSAKNGVFDLGTQIGTKYRLNISSGSSAQYETDYVRNLFKASGAYFDDAGNVLYNVGFSADSIIQLYDTINHIVEAIEKTDQLTEAQKEGSQFYQNAIKWLDQMQDSIEKYRQALNDVTKYSTQLTAITSQAINLENIQTANQYIEERKHLIEQIQKMLDRQGNTDADATAMADAYLNENYRELYNQYNQALQYITTLRQKFRSSDSEIESLIASLDQESLGYLKKFYDLDDISQWKQLESIIKFLIDPNNAERLTELSTAVSGNSFESAQSTYDLYSSLSDQIASSKNKTISKKEFEKLDPQVQEFFTLMANSQFKMTGDAKEFYETVNNLSLSGFKDNINSILKEEERLKTILSTGESDYFNNIKESLNHPESLTADSQVYDLLAQAGYDVIPWLSNPDWEAIDQMRDALQALEKQGLNLTSRLQELDAEFYSTQYAIFSSADSMKELHDLYSDAIEDLNAFGVAAQQNQAVIKAYNQALIDLNNELDLKTLNIDELSQYADYLQEIAQASEDLSDDLINNADAAEIVAKSIMKMNDGFEALGKDWDAWVDVLQKSTESSEEFEIAMIGARDALAQLLDVSRDYVTNDFVKQHLDLITEASNGSADAIDGLKQALTATIVQGIISENALEGLASEIWSSLADIQAQIPNFEVGMELHDGAFLAKMQNLVNLLQLDADQINALFDSLGFEPTFVTEQMPITQEIPASQDVYKEIDRAQFDGVDSANRQFTASFPIVRHFVEDTTETIDGFVDVPALSTNGVTPQIKTITKKATPHFSNYSVRNAGGAASPKKQTKTKTKSEPKPDTSTKDTKDYAKDDRDIYHDINIEISEINKELERTQKIQDRLFGKQLIANLNKQTDILEKQKVKLREKINLQKQDLAQQKEKLKVLGATFDAENRISNYFDLLGNQQGVVNGLVDAYNAVVAQYNATTDKTAKDALKDQLTEADRLLKDAQDYYKEIQTAIKNYDSLKDDMEDVIDEVTQISQKQIELNIKRFRMALEIRLDMSEARRDWNQFKREVEQADNVLRDSSTETLIKDVNRSIADYDSYFDVSGSNSIQALTQSLNETMNIIDQIDKKGEDAIYGDDKAQAMQHLKDDLDTLMNSMQSIQGLIQDVDKAILDTVDDVSDLAKKQLEDYDFVNDLYEHDIDLLQLLYGDKQYEAMNAYYGKQQENQLKQIDFLKQYRDLSKQEWDAAVARGESNLAQKWKQEYMQTVQDLNSAITQSVELLQNKYTNAINQIFDTLDRRITGGLGTDYIEMEWELMNKNANEYLDEINSAFAIQQLQLKYTNIINDDKSLKNQRALQKVLDEQLKNLRDKDKLTQYDVDRAEKVLQIEQARLALEDQKKNKTSLRLRRDSQGNYSYVYAANQEQIANAEEALAKAQNDLYNFDKNAYQKNLDDILSAWRDFQSKYKEIVLDTSLSEEQRVRQLALLRDQYGEYINNKVAENEVIRTNLKTSAFEDYAALYKGDEEAYKLMINNEDQLMGQLVFSWNGSVQQMVNTFVGEGGFIPACQQGFNDLDAATQEYERELDTLQGVAETDFGQLKEGIDDAAEAFSGLITQNDELINKMQKDMINAIRDLKNELDTLIAKYQAVYNAAKTAVDEANKYIEAQNAAIAANEAAKDENRFYQPPAIAEQPQSLPAAPTTVPASIPASTPAATSAGTVSTASTQGAKKEESVSYQKEASTAEGIAGNIYYGGSWNEFYHPGEQYRKLLEQNGFINSLGMTQKKAKHLYDEVLRELGRFQITEPGPKFKDYYLETFDYYKMRDKYKWGLGTSGFDTGGYTGSWGPEGRLAMLHQKELVLNADDTKNMLDSVAILRGIVDNLGGNISTRLSSLNSSSNNINNSRSTETLDQNVSIQATFPNVNSKREIEEALNDLVNLAAQRAIKRS